MLSFFSRETYNALTNWLTDARTLASPNIVIILVGNKKDLEAEREVTFLEASRFAQENGEYSKADFVHCTVDVSFTCMKLIMLLTSVSIKLSRDTQNLDVWIFLDNCNNLVINCFFSQEFIGRYNNLLNKIQKCLTFTMVLL